MAITKSLIILCGIGILWGMVKILRVDLETESADSSMFHYGIGLGCVLLAHISGKVIFPWE